MFQTVEMAKKKKLKRKQKQFELAHTCGHVVQRKNVLGFYGCGTVVFVLLEDYHLKIKYKSFSYELVILLE